MNKLPIIERKITVSRRVLWTSKSCVNPKSRRDKFRVVIAVVSSESVCRHPRPKVQNKGVETRPEPDRAKDAKSNPIPTE